MEFYKIKHKPTGLFYKPGTTNLTKTGKTYAKKPTLKFIIWGGNFRVSEAMAKELKRKGYPVATHKKEVSGDTGYHLDVDFNEFEIVTYKSEIK